MIVSEDNIRLRILKTLVYSKRAMSLSEISKKLKVPQQKVYYHLPIMERGGLIIRDGNNYFVQPVLIDEEINGFCTNRLGEIIEKFSDKGNSIFAEVEDENERAAIIMNCLMALVLLAIYPNGT